MDREFWLERWRTGQIGFHQPRPNGRLTETFATLNLADGARVFAPLSGKSTDLGWLMAQGCDVIGVELSGDAVVELFASHGSPAQAERRGAFLRRRAGALEMLTGDFFDLTPSDLGAIDLVYDRAALVALPTPLRARYAAKLQELAPRAAQLLISFDYDQSTMNGPPFSVDRAEIDQLYGGRFDVRELARAPIGGNLRARVSGDETAHLLTPRI